MKGVRIMSWKTFILRFLRCVVVGVVLCVGLLSLLGYLLGGMAGLVNMMYWGLTLGLLGGFSWGIGMIIEAKFWGGDGNHELFPLANWFIKDSDDDHKHEY
jgi:hypothetical protein